MENVKRSKSPGRAFDVKFEHTGQALYPKSGQTGFLHGLSASCWAHAGLIMNSLMLTRRIYIAPVLMPGSNINVGIDAGPV